MVKKSGRPRFKGAGQYKTFTYPQFKTASLCREQDYVIKNW